jgi:hypothetical protein
VVTLVLTILASDSLVLLLRMMIVLIVLASVSLVLSPVPVHLLPHR